MSDMDALQQRIGEWGDATFPEATGGSITRHLRDEVDEIARTTTKADLAEELADAQHLLFHLAHREGISLHLATVTKFGANQARTWEPSERGYWRHQLPDITTSKET